MQDSMSGNSFSFSPDPLEATFPHVDPQYHFRQDDATEVDAAVGEGEGEEDRHDHPEALVLHDIELLSSGSSEGGGHGNTAEGDDDYRRARPVKTGTHPCGLSGPGSKMLSVSDALDDLSAFGQTTGIQFIDVDADDGNYSVASIDDETEGKPEANRRCTPPSGTELAATDALGTSLQQYTRVGLFSKLSMRIVTVALAVLIYSLLVSRCVTQQRVATSLAHRLPFSWSPSLERSFPVHPSASDRTFKPGEQMFLNAMTGTVSNNPLPEPTRQTVQLGERTSYFFVQKHSPHLVWSLKQHTANGTMTTDLVASHEWNSLDEPGEQQHRRIELPFISEHILAVETVFQDTSVVCLSRTTSTATPTTAHLVLCPPNHTQLCTHHSIVTPVNIRPSRVDVLSLDQRTAVILLHDKDNATRAIVVLEDRVSEGEGYVSTVVSDHRASNKIATSSSIVAAADSVFYLLSIERLSQELLVQHANRSSAGWALNVVRRVPLPQPSSSAGTRPRWGSPLVIIQFSSVKDFAFLHDGVLYQQQKGEERLYHSELFATGTVHAMEIIPRSLIVVLTYELHAGWLLWHLSLQTNDGRTSTASGDSPSLIIVPILAAELFPLSNPTLVIVDESILLVDNPPTGVFVQMGSVVVVPVGNNWSPIGVSATMSTTSLHGTDSMIEHAISTVQDSTQSFSSRPSQRWVTISLTSV